MAREGYVYIAGPYMGSGKAHNAQGYHEIDRNISRAREKAAFLAANGIPYFCPHLNSCHFEVIVPDAPVEFWYEMDIRLLVGASAVLLVEGWESSSGTAKEIAGAKGVDIPIFLPDQNQALKAWWEEGIDG